MDDLYRRSSTVLFFLLTSPPHHHQHQHHHPDHPTPDLSFVFPALPLINLAAAVGLAKLVRNGRKRPLVLLVFGVGPLLATACAATVFTAASSFNYPGGAAFRELHLAYGGDRGWPDDAWGGGGLGGGVGGLDGYGGGGAGGGAPGRGPSQMKAMVHIDVEAAMTGVSRFGQSEPNWTYSKDEGACCLCVRGVCQLPFATRHSPLAIRQL